MIEITDEPLTRRQARAIEQVLNEDNPQFSNKINSISSKRDWYNDATEWARKWLSEHEHWFEEVEYEVWFIARNEKI